MLDDLAMRTCGACGAIRPSWRGRANHERLMHPDWTPSPDLARRRIVTSHRTWKARQSRAWHFIGAANQAARQYGQPPIPRRASLPVGSCAYCGGEADGWDHVVALSRGGANSVDNLVPVCTPCNQRKNRYPAANLDVPSQVTMLCGWCWAPVVRRKSELRRVRYVVCSPEHQAAMGRSPYIKGWAVA